MSAKLNTETWFFAYVDDLTAFVPRHQAAQFIDALECEAKADGLKIVRSKCCLHVPEWHAHPTDDNKREAEALQTATGIEVTDSVKLMGTVVGGR